MDRTAKKTCLKLNHNPAPYLLPSSSTPPEALHCLYTVCFNMKRANLVVCTIVYISKVTPPGCSSSPVHPLSGCVHRCIFCTFLTFLPPGFFFGVKSSFSSSFTLSSFSFSFHVPRILLCVFVRLTLIMNNSTRNSAIIFVQSQFVLNTQVIPRISVLPLVGPG